MCIEKIMKTLGDRVRKRRLELGYTQEKLAELTGVSQGLIGQIENGHNQGTKHIAKLARALQCSAYHLETGKPDHASQLRVVNPDGNVVDSSKTIIPSRRVPVISLTEAGNWRQIVDSNAGRADYETTPVDDDVPVNKYTYAIRVIGDSMFDPGAEKSVPDGAVIIVDPTIEARHSDLVVARFSDGTMTFRQLMIDSGRSHLKAINPRYFSIKEMPPDAVICGVVIQSMTVNVFRR